MIRTVTALAFGGPEALGEIAEEGLASEPHDPLAIAEQMAWYWKIAIPAAGGLVVGPLIYFFAREAYPRYQEYVRRTGGRNPTSKAFLNELKKLTYFPATEYQPRTRLPRWAKDIRDAGNYWLAREKVTGPDGRRVTVYADGSVGLE